MTSLDTTQRPLSLAERAAAALGKPIPVQEKVCLLLDVSGSMADPVQPGLTKITALRDIVRTLTAPHIYAFSRACKKINREAIPDPDGGTRLDLAFARVKANGMTRAVLITDGLPDDEDAAIREAQGLCLEVFYVGPAPRPAFLDRLTAAAGKGSSAHMASLQPALAGKLQRLLLTAGGK